MLIKRFRAKSIQEALQIVRDKLGPDACVLETREVRGGLIGRKLIEVEASNTAIAQSSHQSLQTAETVEVPASMPLAHSLSPNDPEHGPSIASQLLSKELAESASASALIHSDRPIGTSSELVSDPEREFFQPVNRLRTRLTPGARELLEQLIVHEVDPVLASRLVNEAVGQCAEEYRSDRGLLQGLVGQLVANRLTVSTAPRPIEHEQRIMAVVGPHGVGKTTLLGRIAEQMYRESSLQIGIVAMDTWRSDSVEQMLALAEQVDAQVEVIDSNAQLPNAMQRLREMDVVFIDTAGRSPSDAVQMESLRETLAVAQPDETHLVLGAGTSSSAIRNSIDRFREVGADHLAICKTEDSSCLGQWLAPLVDSGLPMRYVSCGQNSGSPLVVSSSRHLASLLLGMVQTNSHQSV